jgi:hypothetical protein
MDVRNELDLSSIYAEYERNDNLAFHFSLAAVDALAGVAMGKGDGQAVPFSGRPVLFDRTL